MCPVCPLPLPGTIIISAETAKHMARPMTYGTKVDPVKAGMGQHKDICLDPHTAHK